MIGATPQKLAHQPTDVFSIDNVDVQLGAKRVLAHCTLRIQAGVTCIVGQSGTGKSTLLKAMVGLIPLARGSIRFRGLEVSTSHVSMLAEIRRNVAFVFQNGALFSSLSVFDNCALALRERDHLSVHEIELRVFDALERVGLSGAHDRMPTELSGGMMKRAAIARALAQHPDAILFDEPTTGADPILTTVLMQHIRAITGSRPAASVIMTHDIDAVRRFADRIILLFEGNAIWDGVPLAG
ncbi:ABC transporter ATP-binding protein [Vulcanimicrobium alpinum]|uniref:ABC transporter ATP-binding protein n=1 Tax=Vulcanimicrobium alpinum TaxID=3016050 RepID=A0AAN1XZI7_UNVUL|nr:ATP-binding cassette domain-containing protein [Vulcanimicrobium alpinum]BDE08267.1 ABC transporter ATP-binding protein [Vulcanimicrobium alpinum]